MDVITGERFSVWIYFFISYFCTVTSVHVYGECFHKPSFVGSYSPLKANAGPQSQAVTEHGFSEIPIKVDVQVKSTRSSSGSQVVFPGIGSSQRDDDFDSPYGGVVYRYDKNSVYMYVPNRNDGFAEGTVIYTGGSTWVGSSTYNESQADVRARAWKTSDFPKPDFESNWTLIRAQNETDSYKEIPHGLGMEPEYVIVQVRHGETDMVSEGIGSSMHLQSVNSQTEWGGLIYSYNKDIVRLWVPGFDGLGYVFSAADGWGDNANITVDYGYVKIRAWKFFNGKKTVSARLQYGKGTTDVKDYSFARRVSVDDGLLSVTVKSSIFVFPAMGAVQNSELGEAYGGVVYSYSETALHLWHSPISGKFDRGYIIDVDNYWGSAVKTERSKTAQVQIRAWNAYGNTCPPSSIKMLTMRTTAITSTPPYTIPTATQSLPPAFASSERHSGGSPPSSIKMLTMRTTAITSTPPYTIPTATQSLPPAFASSERHSGGSPPSSIKMLTMRTTAITSTTPYTIPTATQSLPPAFASSERHSGGSPPSSIKMLTMRTTAITSTPPYTIPTATQSLPPAFASSERHSGGSPPSSIKMLTMRTTAITSTTPYTIPTATQSLPPAFASSERHSGGISSVAVGVIAAVASLVGIGCLSGLLFALIQRTKIKKRKAQVEPGKGEMENNQEHTDVKDA